jgi:hypothetical protein
MKIYPKKIIIVFIFVVIVFAVIVSLFYLPKDREAKSGPLEITVLETANNVSINPNKYVPEYLFTQGDKIWIYMEYTNVSHNDVSDFYVSLSVHHLNGERLGFVEDRITKNEKACFYYFNTNESWPVGIYIVSSTLIDNLSGETAIKSTDFNLV